MKTFVRCKFVPIILCLLSLGLLCSSVVAKGATVEKASAGQVNVLTSEMVQVPVVLPDIAVAPSTAIISSIQKDPVTQETASAKSPPANDLQCAITKVCAAPKYGLVVTHQSVLSVVRT